jgi:hypothetical protein
MVEGAVFSGAAAARGDNVDPDHNDESDEKELKR